MRLGFAMPAAVLGAGILLTIAVLWLAHRCGQLAPRRRATGAPATVTVSR